MSRVMVIDDNTAMLVPIREFLQMRDHELITAIDGKEALQTLESLAEDARPHIFCVDYNMPNMDGYEFLQAIKKDPAYSIYKNLPVIGIGDFPKDKREYLVRFHPKPFRIAELADSIDAYCRHS